MDLHIGGKRTDGGKVSIKKFIDGLMLEAYWGNLIFFISIGLFLFF